METRVTLLESIKNVGDDDSWSLLNELYAPLVRLWLHRSSVRIDDEDDLVQEVFMLVVAKIETFDRRDQTGSFRSWLKKVTVNCLRNYFRKRGNKAIAPGGSDFGDFLAQCEDPHSQLSQIWNEEHERGVLEYLLKNVKQRFRPATYDAFYQTAIQGRPSDEVAKQLGVSRGVVHTAKSRVLAEMRRLGKGLLEQ